MTQRILALFANGLDDSMIADALTAEGVPVADALARPTQHRPDHSTA